MIKSSTIPDSAVARFDATAQPESDTETVSSFNDQINGYNLTDGSPTMNTGVFDSGANGVDFSGGASISGSSLSLSQPLTIIGVHDLNDGNTSNNSFVGDAGNGQIQFELFQGDTELKAGTTLASGTTNSLTGEITVAVFDGADSLIRQNGSKYKTGDAGTNGFANGLHIAETPVGEGSFDGVVGELIVYDGAISIDDIQSEEQRLNDKFQIY